MVEILEQTTEGAWMAQTTFGERLRKVRMNAGLTQKELADKIGVQHQAVARWESGQREPNWSNAVAMADALNVSLDEFRESPKKRKGDE